MPLNFSEELISNVAQNLYRELVIFEYTLNEAVPLAGSIVLSNNVRVYPAVTTERIPCKKSNMTRVLIRLTDKSIQSQEKLKKLLEQIKSLKQSDLSSLDSINLLIIKKYQLKDRLLQTGVNCDKNREILKNLVYENAMELKEKFSQTEDSTKPIDNFDVIGRLDTLIKEPLTIVCQSDSIPVSVIIQKIKGSGLSNQTKGKLKTCIENIKSTCNCTPIKLTRIELKRGIKDAFADISVTQDQIGICNRWIELLNKKITARKSFDSIAGSLKSYSDNLPDLSHALLEEERKIKGQNNPYYNISNSDFNRNMASLKNFQTKLNDLASMDEPSPGKKLELTITAIQQTDSLIKLIEENCINAIDTINKLLKKSNDSIYKLSHILENDSIYKLVSDSLLSDTNYIKNNKNRSDSLKDENSKWIQRIKEERMFLDKLKSDTSKLAKFSREINETLRQQEQTIRPRINNFLKMAAPFRNLKVQYDITVKYIGDLENAEKSLLDPKKYEIDSVQIEFNDGVLKNIVVTGDYQCRRTIYTNIAPIQFTGITHLEKVNDIDLFDKDRQNTTIRLGDVFTYIPALHVDAEDYCPSDSVYRIKAGPGPVEIKKATKEKVNRILEAKTYTDLVGFGVDQPNGLIQFEISKKIPLFTHRIKYSKNYRSFISFGSYYEPTFTLAKLEQNNKFYYPVQQEDISGKLDISTIDVYKYSSMRMAVLYLNLINWEIAEVKSAMEFNGGFSLLYTPVKDSVSDKNSVSQWGAVSGMPFMEIKFLIKPDTRYGFSLSADLGWLFLWDTRLKMINDPMNPTDSKSYNRKLLSFRFDAFYKPFRHSENAAFFRVTNVHTFPMSLTYLQVQLGFAFNIFGKSSGQK